MTPQTATQWQEQIASLAWLKRQFQTTWGNTVLSFEVGRRVLSFERRPVLTGPSRSRTVRDQSGT